MSHLVRQIRPPHTEWNAGTSAGKYDCHRFDSIQAPALANTPASVQNTVRERNLKVRTPCFVSPGHVVPTAFSGMTHSCTQNSVKTATGVFDFGLKCHFSGPLFPKSANNRHISMMLYIPSAILGRNPGRQSIFINLIRAAGEKTRIMHDFYAPCPCYWGETKDEERFLSISSVPLGRNPGRQTVFSSFHPGYWGDFPDRQFELYTLPTF